MIQITIDGPAGAGKSSVARAIATKLNYTYIDTGAMYRTVSWKAFILGLNFDDEYVLTVLAEHIDIRFKRDQRGGQIVLCDDFDVTKAIRSPQINQLVSKVSAVPGVRQAMVKAQQLMAEGLNVVMDGRDAGTVILPHADFKIFLTATVEERARRRLGQQRRLGLTQDIKEVIEDMTHRDYQDINREISPLKPAKDAIILDCTDLNFGETVSRIIEIIHEKPRIPKIEITEGEIQ